MTEHCPNCDTLLVGRWCHACGQKRIEPDERTVRWFLGEFFAALTNLDSRFMRSLVSLLTRPGQLAAEWMAGRRARWLPPIALFLLMNVVYFFAPQITDLNLPLRDQVRQWYGDHAQALVDARLAERDQSFEEYAVDFEREALSLAKTLIVLHVPPFALALMVLAWNRRLMFVDHLVVSLQVWTALLFAILAVPLLLTGLLKLLTLADLAFDRQTGHLLLNRMLTTLTVLYLYFTLRNAYGMPRWRALLLAPVAFLAGAVSHFLYRGILFYVTFALS
jgi:hypothetical protein